MSRGNKKICSIHDLQSRTNDVILTKKDCDLISFALCNVYYSIKYPSKDRKQAFDLARYFKDLTKIKNEEYD